MNTNTEHINIFIAYSRKDEQYLNRLRTALKPIDRRNEDVNIWLDKKIKPGEEWDKAIKTQLHKADIILLLMSIDALASDYFYDDELQEARNKHEQQQAIVIPVILRTCDWEDELGHLQALPKDGKPINAWTHPDEAYTDIVRGIKNSIKDIRTRRNQSEAERKAATEAAKKAEQERIQKEKEVAEKAEQDRLRKEKEPVEKEEQRRKERERIAAEKRAAAIKAAEQDRLHKEKAAKIAALPTPIQDLLRDMIHVQGGTFQMGSNGGHDNEKPIHTITLDDFKIGKYPITQAQYKAVTGENPSKFKVNYKQPVENVSWHDAQDFIQQLNKMTGEKFRLPTEAEWEFAARGGIKSKGYKYAGSNDIDKVAWYGKNSGKKTHLVGTKDPNELEIHDMSGNLWEWCEDWFDENYYKNSPEKNPKGPTSEQTYRVLRGGSWHFNDYSCRSAVRYRNRPKVTYSRVGFRLAQTP